MFDQADVAEDLHFVMLILNPYLTNGFSHHYQLGESTFIFRGVRSVFLARLHEVHRAIVVTSVVHVYVYVRVTLLVKVFKIVIS